MAIWPVTLPQRPLTDSFVREYGDGLLRTEMETGIAKTRTRFTAVADKLTCVFRMSSAQVAVFRAWYVNEVGSGASRFTWTAPDTLSLADFRITKPPRVVLHAPGYWRVDLEMEQLP